MVEEYIKELSLQYNVPSEPQDFILRMFSFVEIQHYIRQELKEGSDGIIVVYNKQHINMYCLVQLHKLKVILIAACLLVVESIDAHICLLQFLRSIVEWVGGVL